MTDIKTLIVVATGLYGKIARAYDNLMKVGEAKITLGVVEARLQNLEKLWEKFDSINYTFAERPKEIEKEVYALEDIPSLGEEAYLTNKALMLDIKTRLQLRLQASLQAAGPAAGTSTAPATRSTLPKIQPPPFTGNYEDWPSFRDLFQSIIGKNPEAKPVDKLHYLKLCVKGDAELLLRPFNTTGDNYEPAWQALSSYYENKRLLTRHYINTFKALPKMKGESPAELKRIFHGAKTTYNALKSIDRPINRTEDFFVDSVVNLLDSRTRRQWEDRISDSTDPPSYATLEAFIERRLHTLDALFPTQVDSSVSHIKGGAKSTRSHHTRKQEPKEKSRSRCSVCQGDHFLMFCDDYKKKTAQARKQHVSDQKLCANCLGRHKLSECSSKKTCTTCGERHHSSLHDAFGDAEPTTTAHVAQGAVPPSVTVLLATARVRVFDRYGNCHPARALIDQGSESSFISERLTQQLQLPRTSASVAVFGVGGTRAGVSKGRVKLTIQSLRGDPSLDVDALVLANLTSFTGGYKGRAESWSHIRGLALADPDYQAADPVDLLLGVEVYGLILCQGLKKGGSLEPIAQQTSLGWIFSGAVDESTRRLQTSSHQCRIEDDVASLVRQFWEQEELSRPTQLLSKADQECEEHYRSHHSRTADGRYIVRLPTIEPLPDLSGTRRAASRALQYVSKKFERESTFRDMYFDFMQQYLDLQHMMPVPTSAKPSRGACFLPHHGVLRLGSDSTKLRVVFNGSSPLSNGDSLNKFLLTGPNLLPSLADILLRWRRYRYAFATDIEKMYRQILVHPDDRSLQRILWKKDIKDDVKEYWLCTVTYGLSCAPYLAIRTLRQLAEDEGHRYPRGASILLNEVYMDDILSGAATLEDAETILHQLTQICKAGGFSLKKWSANHPQLLKHVKPEDRLQQEARWWLPGESHSTLGLRWQPCDDRFSFATQQISLPVISKRSVLALTAKLFDPLGWLSPTTVLAKIFIQSTWLLGLEWDSPLPDDEARKWLRFQSELPALENLQVPRWLGGEPDSKQEIHGFADASERAYSAVVYLKSEKDGIRRVTLLAAKTKVAPLKQVSLPRLELSAAALLTRLVTQMLRHLETEKAPIHLWSDSTVTLGWIRGHPSSWATYVANRVSEIQTLLPDALWHHVPGRENPADCASRGIYPKDLVVHPLWWQGPYWLRDESSPWTTYSENFSDVELPERRTRTCTAVQAAALEEPELLFRYSSLRRLLRTTAWCLRWLKVRRSRALRIAVSDVISAAEMHEALLHWLRVTQAATYKEELKALLRGKPLSSRSALLPLTPFLDEEGILRVGGRLRHSQMPFDAAHPIILSGSSRLTHLVIDDHHQRTLHGSTQMTLGSLRQEYWVPRGRSLVKAHIHRCVRCLRWRAAITQPLMGDLPAPRVTPGRPFLEHRR